jgi:hypothetical protein
MGALFELSISALGIFCSQLVERYLASSECEPFDFRGPEGVCSDYRTANEHSKI